MRPSSALGISDRAQWPDDTLRSLSRRIDEELTRRRQEAPTADVDLATLEERLKREARRYERGNAVIRGDQSS